MSKDQEIERLTERLWTSRIPSFSCALALALTATWSSISVEAMVLPVGPELDQWSEMDFPSGVSGNYSSGTQLLTLLATPSNDLEIGVDFGPSNPGRHYGTGGALGGPFGATLNVSGLAIQADGTVASGGVVTVTFNGGAPGSIGDDYGIVAGSPLLTGSVQEVLLEATGVDTLDILFSISGGALQTDNPSLGTSFAPAGIGVLRIAGVSMPSDFSQSFSLSGATIDAYGIPEPNSAALAVIGATCLGYLLRRKRLSCQLAGLMRNRRA